MPLILGARRIESKKKQKKETKLRLQQALLALDASLVRSFMGLCAAFSFEFFFAPLVWLRLCANVVMLVFNLWVFLLIVGGQIGVLTASVFIR